MVNDAKLAAYIERLNRQDRDELERRAAYNQRMHRPVEDSFSVLTANPSAVRDLNAGSEFQVIVRRHSDATEAELVEFANRGYDLKVAPREVFDLSRLGEALALFKVVRITGLPMIYTGWEALESLRAVEILTLEGNPPVSLELGDLPHLEQVNITGANALSATRNLSVRSLGLGFQRVPDGLQVDAPVEDLRIEANDVDFAFLTDMSNLERVFVWKASTVDASALSRAHGLRRFELNNCKGLQGAAALAELTGLETVGFTGLRTVDDLEALTRLRSERIWAVRNYLFDPSFVTRAGGEAGAWSVQKYRGPATGETTGSPAVAGAYAPFYVRPYARKLFQVAFDDWDDFDALFSSDENFDDAMHGQIDFIAEQIIGAVEPALLASDGLYFDSDAESMMIITPDEKVAQRVAELLANAWTDSALIRSLARQGKNNPSRT